MKAGYSKGCKPAEFLKRVFVGKVFLLPGSFIDLGIPLSGSSREGLRE